MSSTQQEYFQENYASARAKLLEEYLKLKRMEPRSEHLTLKINSSLSQELYVDALYVPAPHPQGKLFILSSGVHGAEASVGSALQLLFLQEQMSQLRMANVGVLIFHALNPYGYASGTRVTESSVDLNRNFFLSRDAFFTTKNLAYEKHQELLSPRGPVDNLYWQTFKIAAGMIGSALRGKEARHELTQAFAGGQYVDPKGIYFGGQDFEPQVQWVGALLDRVVSSYKEVIHFDIHSGLGRAAELVLIQSLETAYDKQLAQRVSQWALLKSPHSEGFYVTSGDFVDFVYSRVLARGVRVAAYTAEFGTLGDGLLAQLKTSSRIILENRLRHWGSSSQKTEEKIKKNFAELFNPSDLEWRKQCLEKGINAIGLLFNDQLNQESRVFEQRSSQVNE